MPPRGEELGFESVSLGELDGEVRGLSDEHGFEQPTTSRSHVHSDESKDTFEVPVAFNEELPGLGLGGC